MSELTKSEARRQRDTLGEIETAVDTKEKERVLRQKRETFDDKLVELGNKTIDYMMRQDENSQVITEMMTSFLEVALQMRSVMDTISALNQAMGCITEAITFVDQAIDFNHALMETTMVKNYGWFARLRNKMRIRKAVKNNVNRMLMTIDTITGQFEMSQEVVSALSVMSDRIRLSMDKTRLKRAKKEAKRAKREPEVRAQDTASPVKSFLETLMKERGIDPKTTGSASTDSAPAEDGGKKGGPSDISDII